VRILLDAASRARRNYFAGQPEAVKAAKR